MSEKDTERVSRLKKDWGLPLELGELPMLKQLLGCQDAGMLARMYAEQMEREETEHRVPSHLPRAPDLNAVPGM